MTVKAPDWVKRVLLAPQNKPLELGATIQQILGLYWFLLLLLTLTPVPRIILGRLFGLGLGAALFALLYIGERMRRKQKR